MVRCFVILYHEWLELNILQPANSFYFYKTEPSKIGRCKVNTLRFCEVLLRCKKGFTTYKEYISSYSFAPSREDFKMHKNSFAIFLIVSAIYMLLSFWLFTFKWSRPRTEAEVTGQNLKKRMVQANCGCVLIAMYLYYRHNRYCEPGMYSIFSIFEYGVVLTNMGYHWTSYYDFYDKTLQV